MHINMASQTVREHFQLSFVVWLTMALPTVRDFAMFLMTPDTANLPMFTRRPCHLPKTSAWQLRRSGPRHYREDVSVTEHEPVYDKSYSPAQAVRHNGHRDILCSSGCSRVFRGDSSDNPALYVRSGNFLSSPLGRMAVSTGRAESIQSRDRNAHEGSGGS